MTEAIEHLKNWCTDQHKLLSKNLDLKERGLLHTSEGHVGGGVVDTTP
ncbi:hypothetical protein [Methylorubrum sp. SL192]|nr:hypothetical protein [Methylorubrum sp. SL192]MCY1644963.1 hypothetical protein [Methylorubrum sp. SL192]